MKERVLYYRQYDGKNCIDAREKKFREIAVAFSEAEHLDTEIKENASEILAIFHFRGVRWSGESKELLVQLSALCDEAAIFMPEMIGGKAGLRFIMQKETTVK